jgi:hypothetical protein
MNLSHLIDGHSFESGNARWGDVFNPSQGSVIARVPLGGAAEVDAAVQSAGRAFRSWSTLPVPRRAAILFEYKRLLDLHADELARLVTRENGKTLDEARGDVRRGIEVVDFACGIAQLTKGESLPQVADQIDAVTMREPIGVCAGITPFNFPAMVPMWMFPLAIACGNTSAHLSAICCSRDIAHVRGSTSYFSRHARASSSRPHSRRKCALSGRKSAFVHSVSPPRSTHDRHAWWRQASNGRLDGGNSNSYA